MDPNKKIFGQRFVRWIHSHKKLSITLGIILVLLVAVGVTAAVYLVNQKPAEPTKSAQREPEPAPEPPKYYSNLTGNLVESEAITKQAVTGIMIENSPDARPQSG